MAQLEWDDEAERKFSELFDKLDKDGSGTLTFDEIKNGGLQQGASAVGGMGASDEEVNQFIQQVDRDGDGAVSKDEFRQFLKDLLAMIKEQMSRSQPAHAQRQQQNQGHAQGQKFQWNDAAEKKFQEIFQELDEDKSGKLTFDEVKSGSLEKCAQLFGYSPTDAEVNEFMNQVDLDGDGAVTEDEFRTYLQGFIEKLQDPKKMLEEAVNTMMKAIDKDGNGLCSKEEFKTFVQEKGATPLTDEEVDELFDAIDEDGDKTTLNKDELLTVLQIGLANS